MGTGGTLPTSITQTVTLYNTTGVIEKDKGIYFCPFLSHQSGYQVRVAWLSAFKTAVGWTSADPYSDITISNWNPQDRVLTVKGNSDDFRLITEEGKCLNYLILTRTVTKENTSKTFYYGLFITDVEQVGNGSVRLTLQTDDFTNVFFLHNTKLCSSYSGTYVDVFNERLKNCYVARQHYNRVKRVTASGGVPIGSVIVTTNHTTAQGYTYTDFPITTCIPEPALSESSILSIDSIQLYVNGVDKTENLNNYWITKLPNSNWKLNISIDYEILGLNTPIGIAFRLTQLTSQCEEDNLPIFSQIEEDFKYKRQFRDYKTFINNGSPFTKEELSIIESEDTFSNLSSTLKKKCYENALHFVNIVLKDIKVLIGRQFSSPLENVLRAYTHWVSEGSINNYNNPFTVVSAVFISLPPEIQKYKNDMNFHTYITMKARNPQYVVTEYSTGRELLTLDEITQLLNYYEDINNYIISIFVTHDIISAQFSDVEISENGYKVIWDCTSGLAGIAFIPDFNHPYDLNDIIAGDIYYSVTLNDTNHTASLEAHGTSETTFYGQALLTTNIGDRDFSVNLPQKSIPNLKENYFDNVLEFEPYSFYSISYLGNIESILNRKNYYENNNISINLGIDVSDVIKYTVIPEYTINGKKQKMYNESLYNTATNSLLFYTTALSEYLIANRTQMKNQYAVNDLRGALSMVSGTVGMVGSMASGAAKGALFGGAGAGALGGAIQGATNLLQSYITWEESNKITEMNQKAKMGDLGNMPSNIKQIGTSVVSDFTSKELGIYLNHYTIDVVSYNSICKYLERFGYMVNIYDTLNVNTRKGWDYVQLLSFDYNDNITIEQEDSIRQILQNGVTLLHDHSVMISGHNYEILLD